MFARLPRARLALPRCTNSLSEPVVRGIVDGQRRPPTIHKFSHVDCVRRIDASHAVPSLGVLPHAAELKPTEGQELSAKALACIEPRQRTVFHGEPAQATAILGGWVTVNRTQPFATCTDDVCFSRGGQQCERPPTANDRDERALRVGF